MPPPSPTPDEPNAAGATVIARGTVVRGDLACVGRVEVRGTVEGDILTSAHCVVREGARVLGNIEARALLVAGEVEAGVLRAARVEILASAHVVATVRAKVVSIADGAVFEGEAQMEPASEVTSSSEGEAQRGEGAG
jgi:cytoskeletal protein CcmA (bactofilin family)